MLLWSYNGHGHTYITQILELNYVIFSEWEFKCCLSQRWQQTQASQKGHRPIRATLLTHCSVAKIKSFDSKDSYICLASSTSAYHLYHWDVKESMWQAIALMQLHCAQFDLNAYVLFYTKFHMVQQPIVGSCILRSNVELHSHWMS